MEAKINIAEVIQKKPHGTKLYSPICGECTFRNIENSDNTIEICVLSNDSDNHVWRFYDNGKYNWLGEPLLFPSKEMHSWSKFAWKKGDMLVSKGEKTLHVIFEGFGDDTYTTFKGKHFLCNYDDNEEYNEEEYNDYKKEVSLRTIEFEKDNEDNAQTYINTIEERLGGKLNRETLEIEPAQPEFKDGDIVSLEIHYIDSEDVIVETYIVHGAYSYGKMNFYAGWSDNTIDKVVYNSFISPENSSIRKEQLRYATKEEKQQLFDALAKDGKAWDAEKKMIVELKPKVELKPFDKVLVRDTKYSEWQADLFSNIDEDNRFVCVGAIWSFCIPYNEETAKLIGTTNNVEG